MSCDSHFGRSKCWIFLDESDFQKMCHVVNLVRHVVMFICRLSSTVLAGIPIRTFSRLQLIYCKVTLTTSIKLQVGQCGCRDSFAAVGTRTMSSKDGGSALNGSHEGPMEFEAVPATGGLRKTLQPLPVEEKQRLV